MKGLGIVTTVNDLLAIELEAFTIIEVEGTKAERANSEKKLERERLKSPKGKKNGR
jgi:hypothetical protein